jgi:sorbitol-specific phosphotransferase system component IIA
MPEHNANKQNKISPEFAARLAQLDSQQKVRVIVLLQVEAAENSTGMRLSRSERQIAMQTIRESAEHSLEAIGSIIKYFDGQLLAEHPDLLGSIPVEITASGVSALATSDAVKAVIEDQSIYRRHSSGSLEVKLGLR